MSRQEVVDHIGTIAKSGTQEFLQRLTGRSDEGRTADRTVRRGLLLGVRRGRPGDARHASCRSHRWSTASVGRAPARGSTRWRRCRQEARGTEVTLHLRDGEDDLLSGAPASARSWRNTRTTSPFRSAWCGKGTTRADEDETVNQASALWTRPKSEITDEQYDAFYKHVAHDVDGPLTRLHVRVEGRQEYTLLLFIPRRAPVRPLGSGAPPRASNSTCAGSSSWTTPSS